MKFAEAINRIPKLLGDLTYLEASERRLQAEGSARRFRPDLVLEVGDVLFWIEYKPRSVAEAIGAALAQIEVWRHSEGIDRWTPLLVVPHMGEVGRRLCDRADVNWMDLSGNASIRAPGLNVNVSGLPNRYSARGRPQNIFAPKAARVARAMMMQPDRGWSHRELVSVTLLSKGYVSKLLSRLEAAAFVEKRDELRYWLRDRESLLTAWRESYDFADQRILRGFVAERTPDAILRRLVEQLRGIAVRVAVTGLAAAWHYDRHAGYRLSSLYASPMPEVDQLEGFGFREVESGANTWLVEPGDESVFVGVVSGEGVPYVSPLQAYLDLKGHPERASEAAEALRMKALGMDG